MHKPCPDSSTQKLLKKGLGPKNMMKMTHHDATQIRMIRLMVNLGQSDEIRTLLDSKNDAEKKRLVKETDEI